MIAKIYEYFPKIMWNPSDVNLATKNNYPNFLMILLILLKKYYATIYKLTFMEPLKYNTSKVFFSVRY